MANTPTTIGKLLINEAIPEDMRDDTRIMDKGATKDFFLELAQKHPSEYIEVMDRLLDIARLSATEYGDITSFGIDDLIPPAEVLKYRRQVANTIHNIQQDPNLSTEEKNTKVVSEMQQILDQVQKMVVEEGEKEGNPFAISVAKGFKGNPAQLTQMLFGDMLVADHKGRPIPIPGLHGYGEGVTPHEYWAGSYGARAGYVGVQLATAATGFFAKQLEALAQHQRVTEKDCGTKQGSTMDGNDPDIIGYVLNEDVNGIPRGTAVTKAHLPKLKGRKINIRGVNTCEADAGICQKCSGKRDQGDFPEVGSFVGIGAARITGEPVTQSALGSKHIGGMAGVNDDTVSGFEEINQFVQIPKNFRGAAALSPVDGKVYSVAEAPQGGTYITVGSEKIHVPQGRKVLVEPGQEVWAGDMLSEGTPNPAEIAQYKGIGAARRYFTDTFYDILKRNKAKTHRRNVELLAKSFYDRIEITDPDGVAGYDLGQVVPYMKIQKAYKPRKGWEEKTPGTAKGMYLEEPVLHYTIGTRITPEVVKELKARKVSRVKVHGNEPAFQPHVVRAMGITEKDPDWKVRLGGFGLKRGLIDAATHGSESPRQNTSPVSFLMNPTEEM